MARKKFTYDEVKEYIESFKGYKLLSDEYIGALNKLKLQCPEGHIYKVIYNSFKKGSRCSICRYRGKPLTYDEVKEYIESFEGYKLLSDEYINNSTKLKLQCPEGHKFKMRYNDFKQGQRCSVCRYRGKPLTYDEVKEYIESFEGYKLLSDEYINSRTKLLIQCPEGHKFKMRYTNFQQGGRCPICYYTSSSSEPERELQDFISTIYDGEIINNDRNIIINSLTGYNLELDVYLPEINKAVEFNGSY